ncbi:hypothetical protein NM688_g7819 [Phlebia brevispora]|uniref:Uncharacterized protein n=1 Tax=Phlebia brevispora TaxID=194682 RepID=A0ACC1S0X6_9APHY|nr:hypothetical protein NM688_g7819 [Phlebia brevispora]
MSTSSNEELDNAKNTPSIVLETVDANGRHGAIASCMPKLSTKEQLSPYFTIAAAACRLISFRDGYQFHANFAESYAAPARWTFIISAICGVAGILVTYFFVPDMTGVDLADEDRKFRDYLAENAWEGVVGEDYSVLADDSSDDEATKTR